MRHFYADVVKTGVRDGEEYVMLRAESGLIRAVRNLAVKKVEIGVEDGRLISPVQRRKIYATLRDISEYTGFTVEAAKQVLKVEHMLRTGNMEYFSLADCSVTTAREFINTLMEYALKEGVPLAESGLDRTDDIDMYLIQCIRYRKCCICGRPADIHHVDVIGMGADRRTVDDRQKEVAALCRTHHALAHQRGWKDFAAAYKIYGIQRYRTE